VADAVLGSGEDDPLDVEGRCAVLADLRGRPEMAPLFAGLKRVRNIVRKAEDVTIPAVEPDRFAEPAEAALHAAWDAARQVLERALADRDFSAALQPLIDFSAPIDRFFEEVLVMDPDPALQQNRLALCRDVSELFGRLADFSRIRT